MPKNELQEQIELTQWERQLIKVLRESPHLKVALEHFLAAAQEAALAAASEKVKSRAHSRKHSPLDNFYSQLPATWQLSPEVKRDALLAMSAEERSKVLQSAAELATEHYQNDPDLTSTADATDLYDYPDS